MKERKIKNINIQLYTLILSLVSTIISIVITLNQKSNLKNKKSFFNPKELFNITLFNRLFVILISLCFLYVNIEFFNISKKEGENLKPYILQIMASLITIISGLITLYIIFMSNIDSIADIENPIT